MRRGVSEWSSACPRLQVLEVGEFLSPVAFAALLYSLALPAPTPLASQLTALKLYRINGNDNHEHLTRLAQMLQQGDARHKTHDSIPHIPSKASTRQHGSSNSTDALVCAFCMCVQACL